jgi:hypothetical protein
LRDEKSVQVLVRILDTERLLGRSGLRLEISIKLNLKIVRVGDDFMWLMI